MTPAIGDPAAAPMSARRGVRIAKREVGFWAPLLGCGAQLAMIAAAWIMARYAGPIG
ncbi:MAG TPA: hypothetical protein VE666_18860 [Mycobacterium sp.]|nr:hypothetical protein [Mycobacterium sp.]